MERQVIQSGGETVRRYFLPMCTVFATVTGSIPVLTTKQIKKMKNLLVEKTEVKLNDEDKIKKFIEESKSNDGVIIKIQNNIYRHLIDKDGRCFIKNITPIFEFTSEDELETILKTKI